MTQKKIMVLDLGFVRLVSYMQPANIAGCEYIGRDWTGDLECVRNARVSFDADWRTGEDAGKDAKLIDYMVRNNHTSPFEAMVFTFEVKAPIFVLRQWHRHRTWSYNEISARYTELDEDFYVPDVSQITTQSTTNKQARTTEQHVGAHDLRRFIENSCKKSFAEYRGLLSLGCPRELARTVLPVATYSRMFATVNLHNLFHFLRLRLHQHAQYEIRVYAEALLELITPLCPVAVETFKDTLDANQTT